jgi:hypothetical protein
MKKVIYILAIVLMLPVLSGCEDFLDTRTFTRKDETTYPRHDVDFEQLIVGAYTSQYRALANVPGTYQFVAEMASDYSFGGGGMNDQHMQASGHLMMANRPAMFQDYWTNYYTGIARCNVVINSLDSPPAELTWNPTTMAQKIGEVKFLRAFYYFQLVQLFENIPIMIREPESLEEALESPPQAPVDDIYKLIASDLWESYNNMPIYKWGTTGSTAMPESGRVTRWAAASLLARVWLFYTGFYGKQTLPTNEGVELTAAQMATALKEVIDNSGHGLLDDFHRLWSYTNTETKKNYQFITAKNLENIAWVRDGSANKEHIFVTKHTPSGDWSNRQGRSNLVAMHYGVRQTGSVRDYTICFPLGRGWGAGTVNPRLWEQWLADEPNDIRREASIWHYELEAVGGPDKYQWGIDRQWEETGLWNKKNMPMRAFGKRPDEGNTNANLWEIFTSSPAYYNKSSDDFAINNGVDYIWIRFADVLLMHSELTQTADGMNEVRERVGLPPVAYSLANIQKERLYELAFEAGLRWADIRRWDIAEQVLPNKYGVPMRNQGNKTVSQPQGGTGGVVQRYQETKGFFPIPEQEITLSHGKLKQNAGWEMDNIRAWYLQWQGTYE